MSSRHMFQRRIDHFIETGSLARHLWAKLEIEHGHLCGLYTSKGVCNCDPFIVVRLSNGLSLELLASGAVRLINGHGDRHLSLAN